MRALKLDAQLMLEQTRDSVDVKGQPTRTTSDERQCRSRFKLHFPSASEVPANEMIRDKGLATINFMAFDNKKSEWRGAAQMVLRHAVLSNSKSSRHRASPRNSERHSNIEVQARRDINKQATLSVDIRCDVRDDIHQSSIIRNRILHVGMRPISTP